MHHAKIGNGGLLSWGLEGETAQCPYQSGNLTFLQDHYILSTGPTLIFMVLGDSSTAPPIYSIIEFSYVTFLF